MTAWSPYVPESSGRDHRPVRDWFATWSDAGLVELFRRRPDLALPAPGDLATLAARVAVRTSVQRVVDRLDAFALRLLEILVTAERTGEPSAAAVARRTAGVDPALVGPRLDDLAAVGLVRVVDDEIVPIGPVGAALGLSRAELGRPAAVVFADVSDVQIEPVLRSLGLAPVAQPAAGRAVAEAFADPARLQAVVDAAPPAATAVLRELAGHPLATVGYDALRLVRGPDEIVAYDTDSALAWLLNHGLAVPLDPRTVEIPAEVGRLLLGARSGYEDAGPVPPPLAVAPDTDLDDVGTTAVLEVLRWVEAVATEWTANPPPVLRSGGLGVRELRRTSKTLGIGEPDVALLVETAAFAGLLGPTNGNQPVFLPTKAYDPWLAREPAERWYRLARAWLTMTREPALIGQRDGRDKVVSALGFDVERGTVPALRADVLGVAASLPAGSAPASDDVVLERLAWLTPRRAAASRASADAILREARVLGILAGSGVTSYGRAALDAVEGAAVRSLHDALPEPVSTVLVQPDLTVVVPGQPVPALARELALVADLESSGGAAVYRVSEASLRRAFDAGRSGPDLLTFFAETSSTPVPQALTYQVEDLARRYGSLRAGAASSYLRCEDEGLLARVLGDAVAGATGLRALAPTVAVATASPARLLEALRAAGFAPAAESPAGTVLTLDDAEVPRAPSRRGGRQVQTSGLTDEQLVAAVARMRTGEELLSRRRVQDATLPSVPGVTSATLLSTIREAIRTSSPLWLGYVDETGTTIATTILPISMAAGTVRGYGPDDVLAAYQVHRIVAARILEDDPDDLLDT